MRGGRWHDGRGEIRPLLLRQRSAGSRNRRAPCGDCCAASACSRGTCGERGHNEGGRKRRARGGRASLCNLRCQSAGPARRVESPEALSSSGDKRLLEGARPLHQVVDHVVDVRERRSGRALLLHEHLLDARIQLPADRVAVAPRHRQVVTCGTKAGPSVHFWDFWRFFLFSAFTHLVIRRGRIP